MAARGQRAFAPSGDYCRLCQLQVPAFPHGQGAVGLPCPAPEPCLGLVPWRRGLPFPFPLELGMAEERMGDHNRHVPQRRQAYLGPNHCPASESCGPPWYSWREVSASTWDWPLAPRLSPCTCVWERPRECECVRPWYPIEQPFNGDPVPRLLPAKVRDHGYYRETSYVATERYWDCYRGAHLQGPEWDNIGACGYNGHCERRHVTFESQNDGSECDSVENNRLASPSRTDCNGTLAFFPTEVPQSQYRRCRTPGSRLPANTTQGGGTKLGRSDKLEGSGDLEIQRIQKKSQGTVREQIKQVVTELEDVLGGLKQVQLEMKEVVQQIDILTSNIDLGEGEPQHLEHHGRCFGIAALVHSSEVDGESLQRGKEAPPCVRTRTASSLSGCAPSTSGSGGESLGGPCPLVYSPVAVERADSVGANHARHNKSTANGNCIPARPPPRAKVKELWQQRSGQDHVASSKTPDHPFPLAGLAKTRRALPFPQNGQVKMLPQESIHPPDILKIPHYPGKKKQFPSTVV